MKKSFPLEDIVGGCTGIHTAKDMGAYYELYSFFAGYPVMTHEIPVLGERVAEVIYRQHPWLKELNIKARQHEANMAVIAEAKQKHGDTLELTQEPIDTSDSWKLLEGKEVIIVGT